MPLHRQEVCSAPVLGAFSSARSQGVCHATTERDKSDVSYI